MMKRCECCGKMVQNRKVIIADPEHARPFLKMKGYAVSNITKYDIFKLSMILLLSIFFLIPFVSASPLDYDFNTRANLVIFVLMVFFAVIMYFLGYKIFAGALTSLLGLILMFNDFNPIIAFVVISIGIVEVFQ